MTTDDPPTYPPAPWAMVGSMWLSLFWLPRDTSTPGGGPRPRGLYGAAFVDYTAGSPLTYAELLVARMTRHPVHGWRVQITDIWVDSPASVAGGRGLWAIPKGLADFTGERDQSSSVDRRRWTARRGGRAVAHAEFADVAARAPRTPFAARTWQPELPEGGGEKTSVFSGTARSLPARGRWTFDPDGALSYLRDARALTSARLADFAMSFG